jgi:hypothetical protein
MKNNFFGSLVVASMSALVAQHAAAESKAKDASAAPAETAAKCVHSCHGYAECKGNGNKDGKGKNSCANTGIVPKACSSQKTEESCKKVLDPKKNAMCTWYT